MTGPQRGLARPSGERVGVAQARDESLELAVPAGPAAVGGPRGPIPVPGLALPAVEQAVIARTPAAPVLRRKKADAESYAKTNGIKITVNQSTVRAWVQDTTNDATKRKGLLDAWNLDASPQWTIDEPADLAGSSNPFHHSNFQEYQDFTKTTTGVKVTAFGGPVSAFYNRGAPKLGSAAKDWGKSALGDSYVEYIQGLRSNKMTDPQIATALLDLDDSTLSTHLEKRAAAMMTVTVYLAEEWRKQGAGKIYRAILRLIASGKRTFDQFLDDFQFVGSADAGQRQVGRFYDVWLGVTDRDDLDSDEGEIYDVLSPQHNTDYSSDEDMRTDDKKNLKKKRLFADKHS